MSDLLSFDQFLAGADPGGAALYRPTTVIGIGLNYRDTVEEMGFSPPAVPYLFPKLSSSVTGDGCPVEIDAELTQRVDWEGELAVVIGRRARNVPVELALSYVYGYTAANDLSARDVQAADGQWLRGKGMDGFCPFGPVVVAAARIGDPQRLRIRTWVNDELVQDGNTADMIFGVAELVSYCSRNFTLGPGDLILTGTPSGCGDFMDPPRRLVPGDVVEVEVEGIGRLTNPMVAAAHGRVSPPTRTETHD